MLKECNWEIFDINEHIYHGLSNSLSIVCWGNSDQNLKFFYYFCPFSVTTLGRIVVFGSEIIQSVLYLLTKESPQNHILEKSISENGESGVELIRITPFRVIRISQ